MTPNGLRGFVLPLLVAQPNLQVWDGVPGDTGTSLGFRPGERHVALDEDGRAHMHAALYIGSGGRQLDDERLTGHGGTLVATFQVTAVGGDANRCLEAARKVMAALEGVHVPGGGVIRLDFDPGPASVAPEPTPSRHYVTLMFRVALG